MIIKPEKLRSSVFLILVSLIAILSGSCSPKVNVTLRTHIQNADPVGPNHKLMGTSGYEYPLLLIVPIEERENLTIHAWEMPGASDSTLIVGIGDDDSNYASVEVPPDGIIDTKLKIEPGTYLFYAANYFQYDSLEVRAPIVLLTETDSGFAIATMRIMGTGEASGEIIDLGITHLSQP